MIWLALSILVLNRYSRLVITLLMLGNNDYLPKYLQYTKFWALDSGQMQKGKRKETNTDIIGDISWSI